MPPSVIGRTISSKVGPWKGMNEKVSPDMLPEGVAAGLQNVMLDEKPGVVVKRWGSTKLTALPSGSPPRDAYWFTADNGNSWQLVSDGTTLYSCTDPSDVSSYTQLFTGLNPLGIMQFVTAENKVWMSNGEDWVMSWDGTTLITFSIAFTSTANLTTVDSTHFTDPNAGIVTGMWNGMKLVFTAGSNIGTVVTVTAFNGGTGAFTFTPAVAGIQATDRYMVGVKIPRGAGMRFYDGHLFMSCTPENVAELRYSQISDPTTGALMTLDNPQSWPAQNELALNVLDQEKIWGVSPILRDRVLVHKAGGIWRLERDALVTYRLEAVSQTIGSQFPDSWAEKGNLLYFLGQDKDGFPDVFKTDMLDVSYVDPDGGIEPTLRSLQQPNAVQNRLSFASKADFETGTESTGVSDAAGLGISGILPALVSSSNVDTARPDGSVEYHGLLGMPQWDGKWDGRSGLAPSAASPAWTMAVGSPSFGHWNAVSGGVLSDFGSGAPTVSIANALSSGQNAILSVEATIGASALFLQVANGSKSAWIVFWNSQYYYFVGSGGSEQNISSFDRSVPHVFTIQLLTSGTFSVWVDGVLLYTGTAGNTLLGTNIVRFGPVTTSPDFSADPAMSGGSNGAVTFRRAYYAATSSPGVPSPFSKTGNLVTQYDYTRAPDALHKIYADFNPDIYLAGCTVTTASLTVQLNSGVDITQLSAGQTVNLRNTLTGALIANGGSRVIQSVNAGAFTITLDGGGGVVSTSAAISVYLANASMAIQTWTSSDPNFVTGNDPAGYLTVANGAQPTSSVLRYMRVKLSFTFPDFMTSTQINNFYTGILWLSPAIHVNGISAWLTFLDTLTTPAGVDQTVKIRKATTSLSPAEGDWGAWLSIANGNNIGTILSDTTSPPAATWVQLKVEEGPSAVGLLPVLTTAVVNWLTGAAVILPVRAVVHKKRYLLVAATVGASQNNIIIVCDRNDQWVKWTGLSLNCLLHYRGSLYGFDALDAYQRIMDVEGLLNDDGVAIDAFVLGLQEDHGAPHLRKNYRFSFFHIQTTPLPWKLNVSYLLSGAVAFSPVVTLTLGTLSADVRQNFPVGTVAKQIQRKYENANVNENLALEGETSYFDIRPVQP